MSYQIVLTPEFMTTNVNGVRIISFALDFLSANLIWETAEVLAEVSEEDMNETIFSLIEQDINAIKNGLIQDTQGNIRPAVEEV